MSKKTKRVKDVLPQVMLWTDGGIMKVPGLDRRLAAPIIEEVEFSWATVARCLAINLPSRRD